MVHSAMNRTYKSYRTYRSYSFSLAATAVARHQSADRGSQSQSDSERDAERAEGALFDFLFRVVNQVFRRAAALFDGAPRLADSIFNGADHRFLNAFDFGAQLVAGFHGFFKYLGLHGYFLPVIVLSH
jgi:hypothetical protein